MNWLAGTLIGAASGLLASMGMGGGFILVVYLALFGGIGQKEAQGMNLLFFVPITLAALVVHLKNKLVDVKTALVCGGIGAAFSALGFLAARALDAGILRKAFAVFVIIVGLRDLFAKDGKDCIDKAPRTK